MATKKSAASKSKSKATKGKSAKATAAKVRDSLADFGETVVSKTKETVTVTQLKVERAKLERENEASMMVMGKQFVKSGKGTQEMRDLRQKVLANQKQMAALDAQVKKVQGKSGKGGKKK